LNLSYQNLYHVRRQQVIPMLQKIV